VQAGKKELPHKYGRIIVALATDAPLPAIQLQRLAKRATVGLARVGRKGSNARKGLRASDRSSVMKSSKKMRIAEDETINALFE
jgi:L-aminopeptidase/D-esterase-like protein